MTTGLIISNPPWPKQDYEPLQVPPKRLRQVAEDELRETESARADCLRQLREWIGKNDDVRDCLTDDNFLLRFLRVKKFSVPMAQQVLLKYLNYRKRFRHLLYGLDHAEPSVSRLIDSGYLYVSPTRDSKGRRVVVYDTTKFDARVFSGLDMGRAHAVTYETLLSDEENQILGVVHVADLAGLNPAFLTLFSVTEFGYLIKWGEQSFPMRHKEIHLVNMPQALKYVYDFAKSNMSAKLKDRLTVHDSKASLVEAVGFDCLPREWGGETSAASMLTLWRGELEAKKARVLSLDRMTLLSDKGIVRSRAAKREDVSLVGSFRMLQVD
ncbi:retinaldehyde-binding protein 1 [Cylas formicarius]|uniref:retinaldehyde-binding protein 1 n=1 Tax=Cylas formicarius TaxID=197179 RepID=UPI002958327C|nr:retinaldehyde-binding protein 1 [Cylas formicarius]XP_060535536.1 retinaldehyde-binding protein 1 [Cylas formicarius]XP_060535537.1 retinaldehyde-binding protein 1 [Cylas formicarius]